MCINDPHPIIEGGSPCCAGYNQTSLALIRTDCMGEETYPWQVELQRCGGGEGVGGGGGGETGSCVLGGV